MHEKTVQQFQRISYVGGAISAVSVAGVMALAGRREFVSTASLGQLFVLASVVGLIVSSIALVLARKSLLPFWENRGAYLAAGLGAILPSALMLLHFARILQRLMT